MTDEFKIRPDKNMDNGVSCLLGVRINPYKTIMGKLCLHYFSFGCGFTLLILAGNVRMHKSLNDFKFRPHPTTLYAVSWP